MSFHDGLLEQAKALARRDQSRPRQSSLRRAVSTAYYALFHLLIHDSTRSLITDAGLRKKLSRAFDHGEMKTASQAFANPSSNQLEKLKVGLVIPKELQEIAATFVSLQEARHDADYNLIKRFTKLEVNDFISDVDQAFRLWREIRKTSEAKTYSAALLFSKKLNR